MGDYKTNDDGSGSDSEGEGENSNGGGGGRVAFRNLEVKGHIIENRPNNQSLNKSTNISDNCSGGVEESPAYKWFGGYIDRIYSETNESEDTKKEWDKSVP
jgi:hypothetical protein